MRAVGVLALVLAGCGIPSRRTPEAKPITAGNSLSVSDDDKRGDSEAGGGADDDSNGDTGALPDNPPTSEHRADFQPCEAVIEDHAPGNRDRYRFEDPETGLVGFKNKAGTVVIAPTYRFAYEFGPGGVAAAVDGTTPFVFIDPAGKVIAKAYAYDNGPDYFQDGLARIVDARGKIGFLDSRGKIAIAPQYDDAASFCNGKAEVAVGAKTFVIDHAGKMVAP